MGVKVKPGMYCNSCQRPIAAQKQTHKARASGLAVATWGASMGAGGGKWHCPNCGGANIVPASSPLAGVEQISHEDAVSHRAAMEEGARIAKQKRQAKRQAKYEKLYGPDVVRKHPEIADYYRRWPNGEVPSPLHRQVRDAVLARETQKVSKKLQGTRAGRIQAARAAANAKKGESPSSE